MVEKYVPEAEIELVRNPSWRARSDYRPAYLNSITIKEGNTDLALAAGTVLTGSGLLCCDRTELPGSVVENAFAHDRSQLALTPSLSTDWITLNTTIAPLNNVNVRRAIVAALDRRALLRTHGPHAGQLANGYIPPGIPGFRAAGGYAQNTNLDFMNVPNGSSTLAKKYLLAARRQGAAEINAHGGYTGPPLTAVVSTTAPAPVTAQIAQNELATVGVRLHVVAVSQTALYAQYCGMRKVKIAVCIGLGWSADYSDPEPLLKPTFDGTSITPAGNVNWSLLNDPGINAAIANASRLAVGPSRDRAWANVDHMIAAEAPGVPYMWANAEAIASKNINLVPSYYGPPDLDFTSTR
jgi:peptide/nickel transport system substrate-binding protein